MHLAHFPLSRLFIIINVVMGVGTYTVSSIVIPAEAKRQGIRQDNPCPGDVIEFTCTCNESSPAAVRWSADGIALYTFGIPADLGTPKAIQNASFPGLIGTLVDAATFMLIYTADLVTSADIVNGTQVTCGEIITGITSLPQTVFIIGKWVYVNDYSRNLLQSFKTRYLS